MPYTVNPDHGYLERHETAGSIGALTNLNVDSSTPPGTDPVLPDGSSSISLVGAQAASGTVGATGIRTFSDAASTVKIQIQQSGAAAAQNTALNGIAHFDSADFSVTNGFVSLAGPAGGNFNVDASTAPGTNPVLSDGSGAVTVTGGQVAAGTVPNVIRTDSLAANTFTIEVQRSSGQPITTLNANGVSHFNSSHFSVDGNGFVSLVGGGPAIDSFTTDIGGPVVPNGSGNVAFTGSTNIFSTGSVANTMRLDLQGTDHALFIGNGTNVAATSLALGNSGTILRSGGAAADPAWSTATYPATVTQGNMLYASSNNVYANLSNGTNGRILTWVSGPLWQPNAGISWIEVTSATYSFTTSTGYYMNRATPITGTLAINQGAGTLIRVAGKGAGGWIVQANTGQTIHYVNQDTSVAGSLSSTNRYDCVEILCIITGVEFVVLSSVGNLTVA